MATTDAVAFAGASAGNGFTHKFAAPDPTKLSLKNNAQTKGLYLDAEVGSKIIAFVSDGQERCSIHSTGVFTGDASGLDGSPSIQTTDVTASIVSASGNIYFNEINGGTF